MILIKKRTNIYFVHIPKNAGNSIRKVCEEQNVKIISHNIRKRSKRLLAAHRRNNTNIHAFCVSRNPYDRIVSAYHYLLKDGKNKTREDNLERDQFIKPYADFKDFVKKGLQEASEKQLHFLPQVFWIRNNDGHPEVETALRFENLQEDLNAFCEKMGMPPKTLNVVNSSSRKKNWEGYYSEETRNIVSDIYHEDFEYFEYEK